MQIDIHYCIVNLSSLFMDINTEFVSLTVRHGFSCSFIQFKSELVSQGIINEGFLSESRTVTVFTSLLTSLTSVFFPPIQMLHNLKSLSAQDNVLASPSTFHRAGGGAQVDLRKTHRLLQESRHTLPVWLEKKE